MLKVVYNYWHQWTDPNIENSISTKDVHVYIISVFYNINFRGTSSSFRKQ